MELGRKILVLGVSASGKSTFARALESKVRLPLTFMDSVMWKPGWQYIGDEATIQKLEEISSAPEWIIEGYISTTARPSLLERSDRIIYLDYSSFVCGWRYIKRWLKHRKHSRPELTGNPERFDPVFLYRILTKDETKPLIPLLQEESIRRKLTRFRSPREAERFLAALN